MLAVSIYLLVVNNIILIGLGVTVILGIFITKIIIWIIRGD